MQEPINNNNNGNNLGKSELWSLSLQDLFYKYVAFYLGFVLSVAMALFGLQHLRYTTPIYSTHHPGYQNRKSREAEKINTMKYSAAVNRRISRARLKC